MNISQVAKATQLTAKSIRFYESKGLTTAPHRSDNGYRVYSDKHIEELKLIARARRAGFNLDECQSLLSLASDPARTSAEVKAKTMEKLQDIELKLAELNAMKAQLEAWILECPGDDGAECPIMNDLCGHKNQGVDKQ